MWEHTIGILIGGQSSRMGTPKHQIELPCGMTMLEVMVEFSKNTARHTVIVGGDIEGYTCVRDHRSGQGPVAGIEALLNSELDDRYLLVGCDMPLLNHTIVEPLLNSNHEAATFSCDGKIIGLPLMISAGARSECSAYLDSGKRSINGLIASITHTLFPVHAETATLLTSINTPEDLHKFTLE